MNSRATQQFNVSPYIYAVYWLPPGSSAFLLARKSNWLARIMVIRCVMPHAWTQKLLLSGPTVYSLYCGYTCRLKTMINGESTQECMDFLRCFWSGFTENLVEKDIKKAAKLFIITDLLYAIWQRTFEKSMVYLSQKQSVRILEGMFTTHKLPWTWTVKIFSMISGLKPSGNIITSG